MIVICTRCKKELNKPGALVFSPPQGPLKECTKYHLCEKCFNAWADWMMGR